MNVETLLFFLGFLSAVCLRDAMRLVLASVVLMPFVAILAIPLAYGGGLLGIAAKAGTMYISVTGGMLAALAVMVAGGSLVTRADCVSTVKTVARTDL